MDGRSCSQMTVVIGVEDVIEDVETGRINAYFTGFVQYLVEDVSQIHPLEELYLILCEYYVVYADGDLSAEYLYELMVSERLAVEHGIVIDPEIEQKLEIIFRYRKSQLLTALSDGTRDKIVACGEMARTRGIELSRE